MTIAMCPGSFDPPTSGHIDLIDRARAMFDKVIVAVIDNPSKRPMFTPTERAELFREIYGDTIDVTIFQGLLVEHARDMEVDVLVKGIRNGIDFEYEFQMAHMNRRLSGVETSSCPPARASRTSRLRWSKRWRVSEARCRAWCRTWSRTH